MIRDLLLTAALAATAISLSACKPGAPATPAGDSPSASAPVGPAPSTPSVPPSPPRPRAPPVGPPPGMGMPPAVPQPVPIDDRIVERFIAFDQKYLAALPQRMASMREELRKIEQAQGTAGAAGSAEAAGAAHGVLERMKAEDAKLRADAGLSEAQAHTVQELAMALSAAKTRKADLAETRKRFGDASVETARRHEAKLVPLWEAHMKVFQDAMKAMMGK